MNSIYNLHPNAVFAREGFILLDGEWEIKIGRKIHNIKVPFCPESEFSGVGKKDFIRNCIYRKTFNVHKQENCRTFLHFGAVNYAAQVLVNGKLAGTHEGGYTPFSFDVTDLLQEGDNCLTVKVRNDLRDKVPSGKQSPKKYSFGCFYTRTTGIWQSVWLETTPINYLRAVRFYPDTEKVQVKMEVEAEGKADLSVQIKYDGKTVGEYSGELNWNGEFTIPLSEKHLWSIGQGNLYEVVLNFGGDTVYSYFGLRTVKYEGLNFLLNGEKVFQRLVLDQGYYEGGVYTPENYEQFKEDICLSRSLGFNGARLHQKVFDPRYLFESDKQGFLVWGEYASWGSDYHNLDKLSCFLGEWREAVERDFNHPSIITWCPLNETWGELDNSAKSRDLRFIDSVYSMTKALDPTRPCVDVSGGQHGTKTDVADFHCYEKYDTLEERMNGIRNGIFNFYNMYKDGEGIAYGGEPLNLSEFGGVSFGGVQTKLSDCVMEQSAWGYDTVSDEELFISNYEKTAKMLLSFEFLSGYCYTQLYDVEQEQNGLVYYSRKSKFSENSMHRICEANSEKAEIEK